jgi:hypothetical protein
MNIADIKAANSPSAKVMVSSFNPVSALLLRAALLVVSCPTGLSNIRLDWLIYSVSNRKIFRCRDNRM